MKQENLTETRNSLDREYGSLLLDEKKSKIKTNLYEHKAQKNLIINTILNPDQKKQVVEYIEFQKQMKGEMEAVRAKKKEES